MTGFGSQRRRYRESRLQRLTGPGMAMRPAGQGFTLIEFIVVMALLASLMAVVAPRVAGSIRKRALEQEGARLVALTEYGRHEAISQGLPMIVWIDPETSRFGVEPGAGFTGLQARLLEFELPEEISFELGDEVRSQGAREAIRFAPDGYLETESVESIRLWDQREDSLVIALMTNGWGYEVLHEAEYANRQIIQNP